MNLQVNFLAINVKIKLLKKKILLNFYSLNV